MCHRESFAARNQAKAAMIDFIERYCNRSRPHSTIGHQAPAKAMEAFFERTARRGEELPLAA